MWFLNLVFSFVIVVLTLVMLVMIIGVTREVYKIQQRVFDLIGGLVMLAVIIGLVYLKLEVWRF